MKKRLSYHETLEQQQLGSELQNSSSDLETYNNLYLEYIRIIGIQNRILSINNRNGEDIQAINEDPHKRTNYNPLKMISFDEKDGYELGFFWPNGTLNYKEFQNEASRIAYSFYQGIKDKSKDNTYFIYRDTSEKLQEKDDVFMGRTEFDQYLKRNHLKAKLKKYHCLLSDLNDFRGNDASSGYKTYNVFCYVPIFEKDLENPPIKPTIQIESKEKELEGNVMNIGNRKQEEPDFTFIFSSTKNGGPEVITLEVSLDSDGTKAFKEFITVTKKLQREAAKNDIELLSTGQFIVQ